MSNFVSPFTKLTQSRRLLLYTRNGAAPRLQLNIFVGRYQEIQPTADTYIRGETWKKRHDTKRK